MVHNYSEIAQYLCDLLQIHDNEKEERIDLGFKKGKA